MLVLTGIGLLHNFSFICRSSLFTGEQQKVYIYITIYMYSEITSGTVLNGELLYTKILEVNLFAFAYRLFRRDFSPLDGTYCMGTHSFLQPWEGFMNGQSFNTLTQINKLTQINTKCI